MPCLMSALRLSLDINVLFSDRRARDRNVRGTAASMLVDAVRDGRCPAGPVQLVTSVPVIENWADVMERHLGYDADAAREKADLLYAYAAEGPSGESPQIVVGAGHIPFGTEEQVRQAVEQHALPNNANRLFDEITDDRHVLLAALAGRADILATSDTDLFSKGAIRLEREDVVLYPFQGRTLVIARPSFVAHWLRQGIVPDYAYVQANPDDFRIGGDPKDLSIEAGLTRAPR